MVSRKVLVLAVGVSLILGVVLGGGAVMLSDNGSSNADTDRPDNVDVRVVVVVDRGYTGNVSVMKESESNNNVTVVTRGK